MLKARQIIESGAPGRLAGISGTAVF